MKAVKIVAVLVLVYVGVVVLFESLLGYIQPEGQNTLVITTLAADGAEHSRVVAQLQSGGNLYIAANHWPRAWYHQALENPNVFVTIDDERKPYTAVPVDGAEHDRVDSDNPLGIGFRILTGFPPRYFVRLDPR